MNKWVRIALIGLIWGYVFLGWLVGNFLENWRFHFFRLSDWMYVWNEFRQGWVISNVSDVVFLLTLLLAYPLYFYGWRHFTKVEWRKFVQKNVNRLVYFVTGGTTWSTSKGRVVAPTLKKYSSKNTRPRAMGSTLRPGTKESELKVPVDEASVSNKQVQNTAAAPSTAAMPSYNGMVGGQANSGSLFTPPADSPFNKGFSVSSMPNDFSLPKGKPDSFEDILIEDIKLPERMKLEENISDILTRAGYRVMENVMISDRPVNYLAIGATRVLLGVVDPQSGDWLADEERFNGEDPLWFSESSHRVSPVFQLKEAARQFEAKLAAVGFEGNVIPMFIEAKGTIINAEDMSSAWKEIGVEVCRTNIGGPDELKTVTQSVVRDDRASDDLFARIQQALL